ncbi:MAG: hypothetical protein ACRD1H_09080, partial [Vicinamibacterales bacterium]
MPARGLSIASWAVLWPGAPTTRPPGQAPEQDGSAQLHGHERLTVTGSVVSTKRTKVAISQRAFWRPSLHLIYPLTHHCNNSSGEWN